MVILWFFSFSVLPAGGCGCHGGAMTCGGGCHDGAMTCGGGGCGGLWLLQWW